MTEYNFTLPWAPSINGYWRAFRNRQIISKKGRDYRKEVILLMKENGLYGKQITGDVVLSITLNPPTLRRYDVDNFNKSVFDSLTHAKFWNDDDQVISLSVKKGVKVKGGNVQVRVRLCEQNW